MKLFLNILIGLNIYVFAIAQNSNTDFSAENIKKVTVLEQDYDKGKPDGTNELKSVTIFDKKGNIIEEIDYKSGKVNTSILYEYDSLGNKIKETEKDSVGKITKTTTYKYKDGLKIEKMVVDENNQLKSKKTYLYEKF